MLKCFLQPHRVDTSAVPLTQPVSVDEHAQPAGDGGGGWSGGSGGGWGGDGGPGAPPKTAFGACCSIQARSLATREYTPG